MGAWDGRREVECGLVDDIPVPETRLLPDPPSPDDDERLVEDACSAGASGEDLVAEAEADIDAEE